MNPTTPNNYLSLDQTFNIEAKDIVPLESQLPVVTSGNDVDDDYNTARQKLKDLLEKGDQAIEGMLNVARGSDSPRAYEVVGQLIKVSADTAKDLMDVQAKTKKIREDGGKKQPIETQNNFVFAGSTQDLLKALKAEKLRTIDHE
jgi:hypothetical protein